MERLISEAMRLLEGLENGTMDTAAAYLLIEKQDPIVVYFIIRYLREKYKKMGDQSSGVLNRLVELSSTYTEIVKISRDGEKDIMREWFDETYKISDFYNDPEGYITIIIEKLES